MPLTWPFSILSNSLNIPRDRPYLSTDRSRRLHLIPARNLIECPFLQSVQCPMRILRPIGQYPTRYLRNA
ncbi:hypothetical protein ACN38_g4128 [Penicillium nordicum]|uniref:Uncharacterized protein n=1 Tax=Penicillium nordicum TaxID=229535 RepID=A0A0M8PCI7_9EURO|nr:hypothetical protein ACN38_g4128 [Penicillium nordicum]